MIFIKKINNTNIIIGCFVLIITFLFCIYMHIDTVSANVINANNANNANDKNNELIIVINTKEDIANDNIYDNVNIDNNTISNNSVSNNNVDDNNVSNNTLNRWNIMLTDEEIYMLSQIVSLEAGNQPEDGQMAVVEVIFNRMLDDEYGSTLESVLSQPGQFSTWKNRNIANPDHKVYCSVFKVLYGQSDILPFNTIYFARSANNRNIEKKIGDHVFCNK